MERPSLFIGSSIEGKQIAQHVRSQLKDDAEITVWHEGIFGLSQGTLESLVDNVNKFDFAILVLTPDDMVVSREQVSQSPRDNVLFECGLFMGSLGRERTFVVHDSDKKLKVPSDLAGITIATYRSNRKDGNLLAAVGEGCDPIREAMRKLGAKAISGGRLMSFLKHDDTPKELSELLSQSTRAFFWGTTFTKFIPLLGDDIEKGLLRGFEIKFLLINPFGKAFDMAVLRCRPENRAIFKSDLERNLYSLKILAEKTRSGKLEHRVVEDYLPPYTIAAFDPHLPTGRMFVWLNYIGLLNVDRPMFQLSSQADKTWFDHFINQFQFVWEKKASPCDEIVFEKFCKRLS